MSSVEVGVFGPTCVTIDGHDVHLGGPLARRLLAVLASEPGRTVPAEVLVDALWEGSPPASARKTVQKYIGRLRTSIAPSVIQTNAGGYQLGPVHVDAVRFEELLEQGRRALAEHDAGRALREFEEARSVAGGGEPYADAAHLEVVRPVAARLAEEVVACHEGRIEALLAVGRHREAVDDARELTNRHPLRESAWAQLIVALYRANRQSDALRAYRRLREHLVNELGVEPSPELQELEHLVLIQRVEVVPAAAREHTLPVHFTSFIGRALELEELRELLAGSRLVTITGPGGSGKTRLAIELATRLADGPQIWFVDLAEVHDAGHVGTSIARNLGLHVEAGADVADKLATVLAQRPARMIVDNCEHVLGSVASLIHLLLRRVADLQVLATSREPLGLTGEVVYSLGPLAVPAAGIADPGAAREFESVKLFASRAAAAAPSFDLADHVPAVVAICRRLDGIPLALELAARQLSVLEPAELADTVDRGIGDLAAPGEPVPRHRTVTAAIDWSYGLLDEAMRDFFSLICAFTGSFGRDGAARLWELSGGDSPPGPLLDGLVARSMVLRMPVRGASRYRILEPIRAFGSQQLKRRGMMDAAMRAYAQWVIELLDAESTIVGPHEREVLKRLHDEDHHFSAVLNWAIDHDGELALRFAVLSSAYISMASYRFSWYEQLLGALEAGEQAEPELLARAKAHVAHSLAENFADHDVAARLAEEAEAFGAEHGLADVRVVALLALASATRNGGRLDEAVELHRRAADEAERIGDTINEVRSLRWLAFAEMQRGNYAEALAYVERVNNEARAMQSDWVFAKSLWLNAAICALQGDYAAAERAAAESFELFAGFDDAASPVHVRAVQGDAARLSGDLGRAATIYEECLRGFVTVGDRRCTASTLRNLGVVYLEQGDYDHARDRLLDALGRRHGFGDEAGVAECLEGLGCLAVRLGSAGAGLAILGAAERLRARSGSRRPPVEEASVGEALRLARVQAAPESWAEGWELADDPSLVSQVSALLASLHKIGDGR